MKILALLFRPSDLDPIEIKTKKRQKNLAPDQRKQPTSVKSVTLEITVFATPLFSLIFV